MYCPKCGVADQKEDSFCRRCGVYLPDFDKMKPRETAPETHLKANAALTLMTGVVSLTLAVLLYVFFLGKEDTPILIYITAGFLTAMFFWQAQTFWRTLLLKKHLPKANRNTEASKDEADKTLNPAETRELLNEADYSNFAPPSVVERTTKKLKERIKS